LPLPPHCTATAAPLKKNNVVVLDRIPANNAVVYDLTSDIVQTTLM